MKKNITTDYKAKLFKLNAQLHTVFLIKQGKRQVSDPEEVVNIEQEILAEIKKYTELLNNASLF